ncbi:PepSY-like domain-containing protein [Segatella copri]|uniref:PepSY-like domain-containing protein n=1 Tax=Segatella copri TaxID=165179 RepID=UPI001F1D33C1|nr:PepSY-like domain-containing protein [Segatella copri]
MKRILRILMIAICCMVSCNMVAYADNDKPISVNALPAKAQTLLSQHFNGQKVILATIETGVINKSYDVVLQNGTKLEFDKKGNLTEIDCKQGKVPAKLIPQAIRNYLKKNYPAQAVKKIEMNKNEYEVELANGLDLTFNKHFQLIDID